MGRREGRAADEVLRCCAPAGLRFGRGANPPGRESVTPLVKIETPWGPSLFSQATGALPCASARAFFGRSSPVCIDWPLWLTRQTACPREHGDRMRRREFITLLGGAAAWPFAARAQQGEGIRRVGVVMVTKETDPETPLRAMAFRQALAKLGWSEGRNVLIDFRFSTGDLNRFRAEAKELTGLTPHVIVAESTPAAVALRQETAAVPIVFLQVANPIGSGLVASLARPGANLTGFTNFEPTMGGKWLELLKEIAPGVTRWR